MAFRTVVLNKLKTQIATKQFFMTIVACLGVLYLLPKVISPSDEGFVFRMIWTAGKFWAAGQNPYGPLFTAEYQASGSGPWGVWNYPPYWYPIAVSLSYLPLPVAAGLWRAINFVLLLSATHLSARALADISKQTYASIVAVGLAFVCFMQAVPISFSNGQTSIIGYFGLSALVFGLLKRRSYWVCAGLVFLAMKPQIGIVAFAAMAALPRYRWSIVVAGGLCVLATAVAAIGGNFLDMWEGFLRNIGQYSDRETANHPVNGIGLQHFLIYVHSTPVSRAALIVFSGIAAFALFYLSSFNRPWKAVSADAEIATLVLFIAGALFFLPLHSYDVIALAILLMMTWAFPLPGRWLAVIGLAIGIRPGNLAANLGIANPASEQFPESLLASISMFIILAATVWAAFGTRPLSAANRDK